MLPLKQINTQVGEFDLDTKSSVKVFKETSNMEAENESPAGSSGQSRYNLRPRKTTKNVCWVYLIVLLFLLVSPVWGEYQCNEFSPYAPATIFFPAKVIKVYFQGTAMKTAMPVCTRMIETQRIDIIKTFGYHATGRSMYEYANGKQGVTDVWWIPRIHPPRITVQGRYAWCKVPYTPCVRGKMTIEDRHSVHNLGLGARPWYEYPGVPSLPMPAEFTVNCCVTSHFIDWEQAYSTNCTNCTWEVWQAAPPNSTQIIPDTLKYPMKLPDTWRQINCSFVIKGKRYNATRINYFNSTILLHDGANAFDPKENLVKVVSVYLVILVIAN